MVYFIVSVLVSACFYFIFLSSKLLGWWRWKRKWGEFIIHIWETNCSYCLLPTHQINFGGPLETTAAADRVTIRVAFQVFLLIDCTGAWRGCYKPIALPSALLTPFTVLRYPLPPPTAIFALFQQGMEARRGWRRPRFAETDAENSPIASRMKILYSREVCDQKGQSELDTSAEVWSRVFVSFSR